MAAFLWHGYRFGFHIGFNQAQPLNSFTENHRSVALQPQVVAEHIANEVVQGKLRPVSPGSVHVSPMGLIPKSSQPGKFHLICNLSAPAGNSVNDGIDPQLCSLQYAKVDDAVVLLLALGPGALITKLDLKSAYRMVPVHHCDQQYLGITWQGETFCDQALPFGLHSTPLIFTAVADGLAWAMVCSLLG